VLNSKTLQLVELAVHQHYVHQIHRNQNGQETQALQESRLENNATQAREDAAVAEIFGAEDGWELARLHL
jgi:hypothetical protein